MLVLLDGLGAGVEDVGVEVVDLLAAEVVDVVLGQVFGGEDEGQAVLDLVEVGGRHDDAALSRVFCGAKTTCSSRLPSRVEDDVGDLLVFAVDFVGVVVDDVDFDGLAEDVVLAGLGELGFAGAEFRDDLVGGEAGGRGGVELAEACLGCRRRAASESEGGEGEGRNRTVEKQFHRLADSVRSGAIGPRASWTLCDSV